MSNLSYKKTITQQQFETMILDLFGQANLVAHSNPCGTTTYYCKLTTQKKSFPNEVDRHVASWGKGKGWMFEWAQDFYEEK